MVDSDLQAMLRSMEPVLAKVPYGIVTAPAVPAGLVPFATVAEAEGLTVIAPQAALAAAGLAVGDDLLAVDEVLDHIIAVDLDLHRHP